MHEFFTGIFKKIILSHPVTSKQPYKIVQIHMRHPVHIITYFAKYGTVKLWQNWQWQKKCESIPAANLWFRNGLILSSLAETTIIFRLQKYWRGFHVFSRSKSAETSATKASYDCLIWVPILGYSPIKFGFVKVPKNF